MDIIKIVPESIGDEEVNTVNARDLWGYLGSKQDFSTWIKNRIEKYGFESQIDFEVFHKKMENSSGGRPQREYHISIDMAKELAMVENNDKGRQIRRYFIEVEKQWREQQQIPSTIPVSDKLMLWDEFVERLGVNETELATWLADSPYGKWDGQSLVLSKYFLFQENDKSYLTPLAQQFIFTHWFDNQCGYLSTCKFQTTKAQDFYITKCAHFSIRTMKLNNQPWYCAADLFMMLGLKRNQSLKHLDESEKRIIRMPDTKKKQNVISMTGLFRLLMNLRNYQAKRFTHHLIHSLFDGSGSDLIWDRIHNHFDNHGYNFEEDSFGFVYLIWDPKTQLTKIGFTSQIENRFQTLKKIHSHRLLCLFHKMIVEPRKYESELHQKYKTKRIRGEWFDLTSSDIHGLKVQIGKRSIEFGSLI